MTTSIYATTLLRILPNSNGIINNEDSTNHNHGNTLVGLTVMIVKSQTKENDNMVKVIVNLINKNN